MKVWIVEASRLDTDDIWWVDKVFDSKEKADKYNEDKGEDIKFDEYVYLVTQKELE